MTARLQQVLILFILILITVQSAAQTNTNIRRINNQLNETQKSFNKMLGKTRMDKNGKLMLARFITTETDSLQKIVENTQSLTPEHIILALSAQNNFLDTLQTEVRNKTFDANYTRLYIDKFKLIWQTLFTLQPYEEIMKPLEAKVGGIMAYVFRDYPVSEGIKDLAILKQLAITPEKITNFLSNNANFSLVDSLIFISGNTQPELLINFASQTRDEILAKAIREHKSPIIQTLLMIGKEKDQQTYLPFVVQLSEKKLTLADIDKTRMLPNQYYQLLVDAEIENNNKIRANEVAVYAEPIKRYVKRYAIKFYTDIINSLHDEPNESKRYFVLDELRPQDIYYIITNGENDLYTSSYLYIYKKLMSKFPKNGYDSLFRLVNYDQYKKFILMAGRYNTLSAFMKQMSVDSTISIVKRMMGDLELNVLNGLEETINVAESFPGIVNDEYLTTLTTGEIRSNYSRCKKIANPYGMKVYSVLEDIFTAVKNNDAKSIDKLNPVLRAYFKVSNTALYNNKGSISQLVLFYGDEDGKSSYSSFMSNFSDGSKWTIEKSKLWITIKSKKNYPVSIYANIPVTEEAEEDIKAQKALIAFLTGQGIEPQILIHRGHSYHLAYSLNYVTPSVQLAILGSCGGYTEIFELLKKSPDAQVISTKQVGSRLVNEPLLKLINEQLLNQKDLDWAAIWKQLDTQLKGNKQAYDYFQEYVPPYKNISLLVSALFASTGIDDMVAVK